MGPDGQDHNFQKESPPLKPSDNVAVVDCHTHTYFSGDSTTSIAEYVQAFENSGLTHVFVTDHQSIEAFPLLENELGNRVVCGQEQRTDEGEVIGLFLHKRIAPGLKISEAAKFIRDQGGLVYVCHPADERRFSLSKYHLLAALEKGLVDAIEVYNSKSVRFDPQIAEIAAEFEIPLLGGSDSHVASSIGSSGVRMPMFNSAQTFLSAAKLAAPFGRYCDPHRGWPRPVVPSTSF